jgi:ABC-type Fe3+/spermidine/putrescine transport system ATPase subunit
VFTAIDNISLDIAPGSFFVIVGPSGCGKTTLLRILADLEQPSAGTITIRPEYADRPGNSMVFQGDSIFPWMTVSCPPFLYTGQVFKAEPTIGSGTLSSRRPLQ